MKTLEYFNVGMAYQIGARAVVDRIPAWIRSADCLRNAGAGRRERPARPRGVQAGGAGGVMYGTPDSTRDREGTRHDT